MAESPTSIVRAFYAAIEAGTHGEALRRHLTDDAYTKEHPNLIKPRGAETPLAKMLEGSTAGASLLQSQRYDVHSALDVGTTAIVRLRWTGTIAKDVGPFRAGQILTAHIAQFVETHDGRIASVETYDCYEPFG